MKYIDYETRYLSNLYSILSSFVKGFPDREWSKYTKKQCQELNRRLTDFIENGFITSHAINDFIPLSTEQQYCSLRQKLKDANNKYIDSLQTR